MTRSGALLVLPWALWATLENCDRAAQWAGAQPDLREEWTVTNGRTYHTTMTYTCRDGG